MMSEALFLAHRIPWPPDRGDKIRSHHVLKWLSAHMPVHVATFGETSEDMAGSGDLATVAKTQCVARRSKSVAMAGLEAIISAKPISLTAFSHRDITDYVERVLRQYPVDLIYVFSCQMAQYVPQGFAGRVIMDFVDVDSAKFESYGGDGYSPMEMIYRREGRKLAAWEAKVAQRSQASLLVSPQEADLFRSRNPMLNGSVHVLANGVDTNRYDPTITDSVAAIGAGPHLVFTGQMDYTPNEQGVEWFVRDILPMVQTFVPEAKLHIVGRAPTERVLKLAKMDGVNVVGEVPDVRPWLKAADVVVAPLRIARGVQNKVIEAMAMGRPVVASTEAATGIDAVSDQHFLVARDETQFCQHIVDLLGHPRRARKIGLSARRHMQETASWSSALDTLKALIHG